MDAPRCRTRRTAIVAAALMLLVACSSSSGTQSGQHRPPSVSPRAEPARSAAVLTPPPPAVAGELITVQLSDAEWTVAIDAAIGRRDVSVSVGAGARIVHSHLGEQRRVPASNQKLLTSMGALETFGPSFRFPTVAMAAHPPVNGVVRGDLWIVGSGDPEISGASMSQLASRLRAAGLTRVGGSVIGDTSAFTREWWAQGWVRGLSRSYVNRATALAFDGNAGAGLPEEQAAASLTAALESLGIEVDGAPGAGDGATDLTTLAHISSPPLRELLATQNHGSVNFYAEMLLKALGARATGGPGSTVDGAATVSAWAEGWGVEAQVRDGSGLSHENRISTQDLVALLLLAAREPWGSVLAESLPGPSEGTVGDRLIGLPVRAKTGTLIETPVSSLSGYVTDASGATLAFSVISRGLDKATASQIEDEVVRILAAARVG
jgi:D-alanyl-D-alanine carboxypeptidase/D-alanyl-D-alanine-endopeptidase (penicillin-binding protein 4)